MGQEIFRPARMAADDIEPGDVIIKPRSEGGGSVGTVIGVQGGDWPGYRFEIRNAAGEREIWPPVSRKPIASHRPVWVHVPRGRA